LLSLVELYQPINDTKNTNDPITINANQFQVKKPLQKSNNNNKKEKRLQKGTTETNSSIAFFIEAQIPMATTIAPTP